MPLDYAKITEYVRRALLLNELGGNQAVAYEFSKSTGKSGISFGLCQWDLKNNLGAACVLKDCGFTQVEIAALESGKLTKLTALNRKLKEAKDIIDRRDMLEIGQIIAWVHDCIRDAEIEVSDDETMVHLCDYHNQFHLDAHGKCIKYMQGLNRPVTAQDVRKYKLTTKWGISNPEDVERRWNNIHLMSIGG